MGYRDLWMLEASLAENQVTGKEKVA